MLDFDAMASTQQEDTELKALQQLVNNLIDLKKVPLAMSSSQPVCDTFIGSFVEQCLTLFILFHIQISELPSI